MRTVPPRAPRPGEGHGGGPPRGPPADGSTTGVVQPLAPPRVRVMFGRYSRDVAGRTAAMPMPVGALSGMPRAAKVPPVTTSPCWPVPMHVDVPAVGHEGGPLAWKGGAD